MHADAALFNIALCLDLALNNGESPMLGQNACMRSILEGSLLLHKLDSHQQPD